MPIECVKETSYEVTYRERGKLITVIPAEFHQLCMRCDWWSCEFNTKADCQGYMRDAMEEMGFKTLRCSLQLTPENIIESYEYRIVADDKSPT